MKKMKFAITFGLVTSIFLGNVCYAKQVKINVENIGKSKLTKSIISSLKDGIFIVEEEKEDLVKVNINNKEIWINNKYVIELDKNVFKYVKADVLNVREKNEISASKIAKINKNTKVEVVKSIGNWDYIKTGTVEGWVNNDYLTLVAIEDNNSFGDTDRGIETQVYITADSLNVRNGASTQADKIGNLTYYKTATVVGVEDGWYKIKYKNGYGYISKEYTVLKSEIVSRGDYDRDDVNIDLASKITNEALSYVGGKYVYGGTSPNGFDCSGLVYYLYKEHVTDLPRGALKQSKIGKFIEKDKLAIGDLVFFGNYGNGIVEHVGIYIGNGNFVHAANSRRGVVVDTLLTGYYDTNYIVAKRVI